MGRDHSCEGCGNGGFNNDLPCTCKSYRQIAADYWNDPLLVAELAYRAGQEEMRERAELLESMLIEALDGWDEARVMDRMMGPSPDVARLRQILERIGQEKTDGR